MSWRAALESSLSSSSIEFFSPCSLEGVQNRAQTLYVQRSKRGKEINLILCSGIQRRRSFRRFDGGKSE
ncbi:hypothetical protein LINGRAHAP2_LOCUS20639, partial [Linum grandiflorum]